MILIGLLVMLAGTRTSHGLLMVDWGGDYVSTTTDLEGINSFTTAPTAVDGDRPDNLQGDGDPIDTDQDDAIGGRLFSESTPFNPTSGYSGTSGTFYGGAITVRQDDTTQAQFDNLQIQNQGPNDEIHVHLSTSGHQHDVQFVTYWDQADFLNGGNTLVVGFDSLSSVSVTLGAGSVENLDTANLRLVVRESGSWWISDTAFTNLTSNSTYTWNNGNQGFGGPTGDGDWLAYDPNAAHPGLAPAGLPATPGSDLHLYSGGTPTARTFTDITAIGFIFDQDTFHNNLDFHIAGFEADLDANPLNPPNPFDGIPEPSRALLLVLGLASGILHRNRHRGS